MNQDVLQVLQRLNLAVKVRSEERYVVELADFVDECLELCQIRRVVEGCIALVFLHELFEVQSRWFAL